MPIFMFYYNVYTKSKDLNLHIAKNPPKYCKREQKRDSVASSISIFKPPSKTRFCLPNAFLREVWFNLDIGLHTSWLVSMPTTFVMLYEWLCRQIYEFDAIIQGFVKRLSHMPGHHTSVTTSCLVSLDSFSSILCDIFKIIMCRMRNWNICQANTKFMR